MKYIRIFFFLYCLYFYIIFIIISKEVYMKLIIFLLNLIKDKKTKKMKILIINN